MKTLSLIKLCILIVTSVFFLLVLNDMSKIPKKNKLPDWQMLNKSNQERRKIRVLKTTTRIDKKTVSTIESLKKSPIDFELIRNSPIIFIGGFGRSGTTLLRAILDVHPLINCGPETKIVPHFIGELQSYLSSRSNHELLAEAKITNNSIDEAISAFVYHLINQHGHSAQRLCIKDPNILKYMIFLMRIFPRAKFVYMVRDGRDAAYSFMLKSNEKIMTFPRFQNYLLAWNEFNEETCKICQRLPDNCMQIKYEFLITETNKTLIELMRFLNVEWTNELLNHQEHFDDEIEVAEKEWSTDQIKKPINKDGLRQAWRGKFRRYNDRLVHKLAPMLKKLGYKSFKNPRAPKIKKNYVH